MRDSLAVELGRTMIDDNEVIVELGTITYTKGAFTELDLNTTLKLDIQFDNHEKILASVYVNRSLKALCHLNFTETGNNIIIRKIIDLETNTIGFYEGQKIDLNMNCVSKNDALDIILNKERVVAHGKIIKDCSSCLYYVRIVSSYRTT